MDRLAASGIADCLTGGFKGIEKESLRVLPDGTLSARPHPRFLGSPLTNRYITTDFSEALLEFVTPALPNTWEALRFLCDIHQFCYAGMGDELLWATSMPCRIPPDNEIPLARYGSSNVGRMKTVYRNGLGHRYGRAMQTIAGIHFNYSLPTNFWPAYQDLEKYKGTATELQSLSYLGLVRNFRRCGWLILYLFGASPALCKSFSTGGEVNLPEYDEHTYFEPDATSLRMSDLGYSNKTQAGLRISVNSLDEYVADLRRAIATPEPAYEKIGVKVNGDYRQLSTNQLQIENEYYSPVRPKRVARSGERPTAALQRGGIEYVEIRSLDLNVFDPVGINQNAMKFVEAFLIYCLLSESPPLDDAGWDEVAWNQSMTAKHGRQPRLELRRDGQSVLLTDWASEIVADVCAVAELIDRGSGGTSDYKAAAGAQSQLIENPAATPSARILNELREQRCSFFEFAMQCARGHRDYFAALAPMEHDRRQSFETEARESLERQAETESADDVGFDEYLRRYYAENQ